jgi:hypothetical protein
VERAPNPIEMSRRPLVPLVLLTAVVGGCGDASSLTAANASARADVAPALGAQDAAPAPFKLAIMPDTLSLEVGRVLRVRVGVTPTGDLATFLANFPVITYRTVNASVATVTADGSTTGRGLGTTMLIATGGAVADTAIVVVRQPLAISPMRVSLSVGKTATLTAPGAAPAASARAMTWRSSDPSIATVSAAGVVTALKNGDVVITATDGGGVSFAGVKVGNVKASAGRVFTVPNEIDATGTSDMTGPLNQFLAAVPDTATIRFKSGGRYRVEGTLLFQDRNGLTIDGAGATLAVTSDGYDVPAQTPLQLRWPRLRAQFSFLGGKDIAVRGITILGPNAKAGPGEEAWNAPLEAQHAFNFVGVRGVTVENTRASRIYGDFVYLGPRNGTWTSNVVIRNNRYEYNGRQGMSITGAEDVLIERNYIAEIRRSTFDFEPNSAAGGARRVTIRNNDIGPGRLLFLAAGGAAGTVEDVTVDGNRLKNRVLNIEVLTPVGSRRTRIKIMNNVSDLRFGSPNTLMYFTRVDGLVVTGNTNPLTAIRNMSGVIADESCGVNVSGNTFTGAARELTRTGKSDC